MSLCGLLLAACNRKGKSELREGDALVNQEPARALEKYDLAASKGADVAVVLKGRAAAHEVLKEYDKAQELLLRVVAQTPDDLEARLGLARLALRAGNVGSAVEQLDALVLRKPPHLPSLLLYATLADTKQRGEKGLRGLALLEGEPFARFRESAEYLVARASLRAAAEPGKLEALEGVAGKEARVFDAALASSLAKGLLVARKSFLAEELLRRVSALPEADDEVHQSLAELALDLRHPTVAEAAIERLSKGFKENAELFVLRGRLLELRRDASEAAKLSESALATPSGTDSEKVEKVLLHARSLVRADRLEPAARLLTKTLASHPEEKAVRLTLASVELKRGRPDEAISSVASLREDPLLAVAAAGLTARAHLAAGRKQDAKQVASDVRRAHPKNPMALLLVVDAHVAAGERTQALSELRGASPQLRKDSAVRDAWLRLTDELEGHDAAAKLLETWLAEQPSAELRLQLALVHSRAKKFAEAEAIFRELAAADPRRYSGLAAAQREQGKVREAVASMERFVAYAPYDTAGWLRLGLLRDEVGDRPGAVTAYERLLEIEPNASVALNNLALHLLAEPEQRDRAVTLARRAFAASPKNPAVIDTLGWALVVRGNKGDLPEARGLLLQAVQLLGTPECHYHYGVVLQALGEQGPALVSLDRALAGAAQTEPPPPWLPEARLLRERARTQATN